jgi:hypothetical protein
MTPPVSAGSEARQVDHLGVRCERFPVVRRNDRCAQLQPLQQRDLVRPGVADADHHGHAGDRSSEGLMIEG